MSKLIPLLAVVLAGVGAVLFFRRKSDESWSSMWSPAKDSTSSWSKTAAHEAGTAADRVAEAGDDATAEASDLADEVKRSASQAAHEAGKAADEATTEATNLADEVKGGNPI